MKLSKYFTREEFERSQEAVRKGIINVMPEDALSNAILLCQNILDPIRAYYKKPLTISSGYRCPKVNKAIGGATTSQHCMGKAVDFVVSGVSLKKVFNDIAEGKILLPDSYDQLIFEFGSWIHVSHDKKPRKQRLLASYKNKSVVYENIKTV